MKFLRRNLWVISLTIVYFLLQLSIGFLNAKGLMMFNGVISAFQYGACLLMLKGEQKSGIRTAIVLMGLSVIILATNVFFWDNMTALPGLCNAVFYITTLILINLYYRRREKESITDMITGVMNRRGLYKHLRKCINESKDFSIVCLTLDNYKSINDTYGHAYGDELMRKITQRMSKVVGKDGTIARMGGVEFAVVINDNLDVNVTADKLLNAVKEKFEIVIGGNKVDCYMTCYAGGASYPKDAADYESLIKYADIAMFGAMSDKAKSAYIFDKNMAESMNRQIEVESYIKEGLVKDYFYLVYQPQYKLNGKVLRGFETLLRMKTPQGQMVSPGEFIPVAEKTDLILQIDDYVLHRAMLEFKDIVAEKTELTISVNVSAKNICDIGFIEKIKNILEKTGFPAKNLEIEITEYCMVNSMEVTIENIKILREMGIQIALDDFGTGYTSLSYVSSLPINLIKVDKSLVDDIEKDEKRREFVHAVVSMGHLMGCEVIAEGVEEEKQLEYLYEDGCDFVQGYIWGKPFDYEIAKNMCK